MNKIVASPEQAVTDIPDGATVAIAGFGVAHRFATALICALRDQKTKDLTVVCNSLGDAGATRGQILAEHNQVKKLIAALSVPPPMMSQVFIDSWPRGTRCASSCVMICT